MQVENSHYVYKYARPDTDAPFYIGKGFGSRKDRHINGFSHNEVVNRIIRKLHRNGLEPTVQVLVYADEEYCLDIEQKLIKFYGRINTKKGTLANFTDGGEGVSGLVHSEESKKMMSEAKKELTGEDNPFYGKKHSEETLEKMRLAKIGKKHSEEHKAKIRKSMVGINKGQKHSEETKRKISESKSGENHPNWGQQLSEETKKKIGLSNLGKIVSEETKAKQSKKAKARSKSPEEIKRLSEIGRLGALKRWAKKADQSKSEGSETNA